MVLVSICSFTQLLNHNSKIETRLGKTRFFIVFSPRPAKPNAGKDLRLSFFLFALQAPGSPRFADEPKPNLPLALRTGANRLHHTRFIPSSTLPNSLIPTEGAQALWHQGFRPDSLFGLGSATPGLRPKPNAGKDLGRLVLLQMEPNLFACLDLGQLIRSLAKPQGLATPGLRP